MTFLQQSLGKNYKWLYIVTYNTKIAMATFHIYIFSILALVINTLAIVIVWKIAGAEIGVFTYLVVGRIYKSIIDSFPYASLGPEILNGKITSALLRPISQPSFNFVKNIGRRLSGNFAQLIGSLIVLAICTVFISPISFNISNIIPLIFISVFSYIINYFIGYLVGSLSFFVKDDASYDGVIRVHENLNNVLIGTIIPLNKMTLFPLITFLPQAWVFHHPMQIYLGKYSGIEIIYTFLGGITWCLVLWILARIIFKLGLKKNEAVGL
jgi:ABC-2 type transport system permease protein